MTPAQILEATAKAIHDEMPAWEDTTWQDVPPEVQRVYYALAHAALILALDAAAEVARTFEMEPRLRRYERVVARAIADKIDALKPSA